MYSNKCAAKLVNTNQLCKEKMEKLSKYMVLSIYYPTFRVLIKVSKASCVRMINCINIFTTIFLLI